MEVCILVYVLFLTPEQIKSFESKDLGPEKYIYLHILNQNIDVREIKSIKASENKNVDKCFECIIFWIKVQ